MNIFKRIWVVIFSCFKSKPKPLKTIHLQELPDILHPTAVYVLGEGKHHWFVVMSCPCGCGKPLHMSLLAESDPNWQLIEHKDGTISLWPSIWREVGCCSHFFLRHGLVEWCIDGAPSLFKDNDPTHKKTLVRL